MKRTLRILVAIAFLGFVAGTFSSCGYNALVTREEAVTGKWSQVENAYQTRADKVNQLVQVVKGAANFEKSTLESVIQARASATDVTVDPEKLTPEAIQKFEQAQGALSSALGRLLVTVERYPELKATQNFRDLQFEISEIENRINQARREFNNAVQDYNTYRRKFPTNITAGMFGFEEKGYFEATKGSEKPADIDFGNFKDSTK